MTPLDPEDRGRLERAVRRAVRDEGYFQTDAGDFAAHVAALWHLFRCTVPGRDTHLSIVVGTVQPSDPPSVYAVVRSCCCMAYFPVLGLDEGGTRAAVDRCAHNALEAAADDHARGKGCAKRLA